jgi:hypothetical protein
MWPMGLRLMVPVPNAPHRGAKRSIDGIDAIILPTRAGKGRFGTKRASSTAPPLPRCTIDSQSLAGTITNSYVLITPSCYATTY